MSTNTPTELELRTTKVTTNPLQVDVGSDLAVNSTTHVSVDTAQQESIIEGYKKEYSIVGDGLYASVSMDQAPPWLLGLIGGVIDSQLQSGLFDLQQANQSIRDALDGIDVAKNQYTELINIDATIEGIIASRLTTLNATVNANSANIITLDITKVTPNEAMAISADRVAAELNSGSIKAQLDRIDTAIATTNGSLVATTEIMEASFAGVSDAVSTLENSVQVTKDKAEANFAYDAVLKLNHNGIDYYYDSGFGLKTTLAGNTDSSTPSANSEFWIKASKLRFTDANSANPYEAFTYENGVFTYNGAVSFNYATPGDVSNAETNAKQYADDAETNAKQYADDVISDIAIPEVPTTTTSTLTPSGTGFMKGSIWRQQLTVGGITQYMHWIFDGSAWNKVGGTYINGSEIVTGTVDAARINANDLFSQNINVNNRFQVAPDGTLTIKDALGNTILASGSSAAIPNSAVGGLGGFATLSQVTKANIGTYIASAAIGTAYIDNLAVTNAKIGNLAVTEGKIANLSVDTLKIKDNAVTIPLSGASVTIPASLHNMPAVVIYICRVQLQAGADTTPQGTVSFRTTRIDPDDGSPIITVLQTYSYSTMFQIDVSLALSVQGALPSGTVLDIVKSGDHELVLTNQNITVLGVKK